jgi:hypothetical protein
LQLKETKQDGHLKVAATKSAERTEVMKTQESAETLAQTR